MYLLWAIRGGYNIVSTSDSWNFRLSRSMTSHSCRHFNGIWLRLSSAGSKLPNYTLHDIPEDSKSSQPPSTPITWLHTGCNSPLPCMSRKVPFPPRHCQLDTSISQFRPTWEPRSRVSCHTHAHTHETSRLPTDTLQSICEQDTKEEAEVGGDMKTVCACAGWL